MSTKVDYFTYFNEVSEIAYKQAQYLSGVLSD